MCLAKNGYQHMVHNYYVGKVRAVSLARDERINNIETRSGARRYQRKVQKAVDRAFSPRPRKTSLNPTITGVVERPRHRIEKVLFESRPGCLVTANLYVPKDLKEPAPGIIAPCGHTENGKAGGLYQGFCQRLVRSGFVVLMYDPFNQGERDQYHGLMERDLVKGCCFAHNMMGKQMELLGEFFGMWRTWDGIRALDYLLTRSEVDPKHIGVTGNSGGGTMSEWLWAVEDRFTMAAPSCFVTTFLANLENEIPQDCEQYPPGIIGAGLEMVDLMIARAPNPAILLGQAYDYFDRRGLAKAYHDLKHFYEILGEAGKVDLFIGPHGHGYYRENQEAMVRFFSKHARLRAMEMVEETEELDEKTLWATPQGNTVAAGARPIFSLIGDRAVQLSSRRKPMDPSQLRRQLRRILGVSTRRKLPHYRILRPIGPGDNKFGRFAVETEDNIRVILRKLVSEPERVCSLDVEKDVNLYIPHISAEENVDEYGSEPSYVNRPVYALDPRGMGESMPEGGMDAFFHPYGLDYMFHGFGLLLGESYLGRRVHDVLSTMDLLGKRGAERISLYGRGQGAILALFSSLLHPLADRVTLKNGPTSFETWTRVPIVSWPAANFPRGILKTFDITDCMRTLGDRVTTMEPWGPDMKPVQT